jgi:hypothetical protein
MTANLFRRSKQSIDWQHVYCTQCGEDFPYSLGVKAPWPGMPGVRMVLCSRVCATKWMGSTG